MIKKVAVLMGGLSSEREISFRSGKQVIKALKNLGYDYKSIDPKNNLIEDLRSYNPDIVFNALHGTYGEDGCVQGFLEILQIPYTHSGVEASAVAFNKQKANAVFEQVGILTAKSVYENIENRDFAVKKLGYPLVLKPLSEGSSVGVFIVHNKQELEQAAKKWTYGNVLYEEFIKGRELSCSVLNNKALAVTEITTSNLFYDYEAKYTDGGSKHITPAKLDAKTYNNVIQLSEYAHVVLGCKNVSRSDFILSEKNNEIYILETNTHPGLTELSLLPEAARHKDISFDEVVESILVN